MTEIIMATIDLHLEILWWMLERQYRESGISFFLWKVQ